MTANFWLIDSGQWTDPTNWYPNEPAPGDLDILNAGRLYATQAPNVTVSGIAIDQQTVWLRNEGAEQGSTLSLSGANLGAQSWIFSNDDAGGGNALNLSNAYLYGNQFVGSGQLITTIAENSQAENDGWVGIASSQAPVSDTIVSDGSFLNKGVVQAGYNGTASVVFGKDFPEFNGFQQIENDGILRADPNGRLNIDTVNVGGLVNKGQIIAAGGTVAVNAQLTQQGGQVFVENNGTFIADGQMTSGTIQIQSGMLEFAKKALFTSQVEFAEQTGTIQWDGASSLSAVFSNMTNTELVTVNYANGDPTTTYAVALDRGHAYAASDFSTHGNQLIFSHPATS